MIIFRCIIALGIIIGGFIIYPLYMENIIDPIVAIARSLKPDMNILEEFYLQILPLAVMLMILFFGIMHLVGKVGIGRREE